MAMASKHVAKSPSPLRSLGEKGLHRYTPLHPSPRWRDGLVHNILQYIYFQSRPESLDLPARRPGGLHPPYTGLHPFARTISGMIALRAHSTAHLSLSLTPSKPSTRRGPCRHHGPAPLCSASPVSDPAMATPHVRRVQCVQTCMTTHAHHGSRASSGSSAHSHERALMLAPERRAVKKNHRKTLREVHFLWLARSKCPMQGALCRRRSRSMREGEAPAEPRGDPPHARGRNGRSGRCGQRSPDPVSMQSMPSTPSTLPPPSGLGGGGRPWSRRLTPPATFCRRFAARGRASERHRPGGARSPASPRAHEHGNVGAGPRACPRRAWHAAPGAGGRGGPPLHQMRVRPSLGGRGSRRAARRSPDARGRNGRSGRCGQRSPDPVSMQSLPSTPSTLPPPSGLGGGGRPWSRRLAPPATFLRGFVAGGRASERHGAEGARSPASPRAHEHGNVGAGPRACPRPGVGWRPVRGRARGPAPTPHPRGAVIGRAGRASRRLFSPMASGRPPRLSRGPCAPAQPPLFSRVTRHASGRRAQRVAVGDGTHETYAKRREAPPSALFSLPSSLDPRPSTPAARPLPLDTADARA